MVDSRSPVSLFGLGKAAMIHMESYMAATTHAVPRSFDLLFPAKSQRRLRASPRFSPASRYHYDSTNICGRVEDTIYARMS